MKISRSLTIVILLLLAAAVAAQGSISGTVYQTANVRSGPDTRFAIVGQLSADDEVEIDGRNLYFPHWDYDVQFEWLDEGP